MVKKRMLFLFSMLLIIFSSLVIAQDSRDLDVCVDTCKSNFLDEESETN